MKFDYNIQHVPGKLLYIADALSRAPIKGTPTLDEIAAQKEIEVFIDSVTQQLPANSNRLQVYQKAQQDDPICNQVVTYCKTVWPEKHSIKGELKPYWQHRDKLSLHNDLLLFGSRIVVPKPLKKLTMEK